MVYSIAPLTTYTSSSLLDNCANAQCPLPYPVAHECSNGEPNVANQNKKGQAMNSYHNISLDVNADNGASTEINNQRDFLNSRLNEVFYKKLHDLEDAFFIHDMPAPQTPKELKERIAAGLFTVLEDTNGKFPRYNQDWTEALKWRDPAKPANREGLTAASAKLRAAQTPVFEEIQIFAPKDALASVRAFEAAPLPN